MASKWNSKVAWPKDNFKIRCIRNSFEESKSSGNPMIVLDFEVDSPETYTIDGVEYNMAGVSYGLRQWYVTKVMDASGAVDAEKTANCAERLRKLYAQFGLDFTKFDPENPTLEFEGKLVWALLRPDTQEQHKTPTKEQLARGEKQGEVIKHPITGQPLIQYVPTIDEIFGLAEAGPNIPF